MTFVGSFLYRSSTSAAGQSTHRVISPNDRRSSTLDPRRGSSDDVVEQSSFILQLSPSCPCPSSAEVESADDVHLNHKSAPAAKTAAVGNDTAQYTRPTPTRLCNCRVASRRRRQCEQNSQLAHNDCRRIRSTIWKLNIARLTT